MRLLLLLPVLWLAACGQSGDLYLPPPPSTPPEAAPPAAPSETPPTAPAPEPTDKKDKP